MSVEYSSVLVRFGEIAIKSKQTRRRMTKMLADHVLLRRADYRGRINPEARHPFILNGNMPALVTHLFGQRQPGRQIRRRRNPLGADFHNQMVDLRIQYQQLPHCCSILCAIGLGNVALRNHRGSSLKTYNL